MSLLGAKQSDLRYDQIIKAAFLRCYHQIAMGQVSSIYMQTKGRMFAGTHHLENKSALEYIVLQPDDYCCNVKEIHP